MVIQNRKLGVDLLILEIDKDIKQSMSFLELKEYINKQKEDK